MFLYASYTQITIFHFLHHIFMVSSYMLERRLSANLSKSVHLACKWLTKQPAAKSFFTEFQMKIWKVKITTYQKWFWDKRYPQPILPKIYNMNFIRSLPFRGLSGQHQVLCYELKWIIYNHKMGAIIFLHRDKIVEFFWCLIFGGNILPQSAKWHTTMS